MTPLAPLVTAFFRQHLGVEKGVSKHTIASFGPRAGPLARDVVAREVGPPSRSCSFT
jgi:hypothetical protein